MNILPISIRTSGPNKSGSQNNSQSFKASLKVHESAKNRALSKMPAWHWDEIVKILKDKLKKDPIKPYDKVILKEIPLDERKSVYIGGVEEYEQQYYMHDGHGSGQNIKYKAKRPRYRYEDLQVSINNSKEGFYINTNHSFYQIAEDLYNTYKRVRYKEHFE